MTDSSTFSTAGVERIHAAGTAVVDLTSAWPGREQLLGGDPSPVWDVEAPLDKPIEVTVRGPRGALEVRATTLRLLIGSDDRLSTIGLTASFTDRDAAAAEVRRTAQLAGIAEGPAGALIDRLGQGPVVSRTRSGLRAGEDLGIRVGLTVHRLPARGDVPPLEVLEWSIAPAGTAPSPSDEAPEPTDHEWLRL